VEAAPPSGLELMPIPLHTLKRWLSGGESSASDLESTPEPEEFRTQKVLPMVLRWEGEIAELVKVSALRTSDIVVLPASRGGCDRFGWHPTSKAAVRDLLEEGLIPVPVWTGRNERTHWAIGLAEHMEGVGAKAAAFARACGLPQTFIDILEEAGRLHDLGKNDARFQLMLGSFDGKLLAKSGSHEVAVSRKLAGLPSGWRHELGSVAQRIDINSLVRYLVGSHHGRGRPWMPVTPDPRLWHKAQAGDWPALATQLQDQYGFWGLCYLEAILRLADWARSVDEQANAKAMEEQHAA
jgi:CRISPR-associated endonuclease/helicase Cas3